MLNSIKMIHNKKIETLINLDEIISVGEKIYSDIRSQKAVSPKKYSLVLPGNSSTISKWINSMPAYLTEEKVAGIKWISVCSDNNLKNLSTINGFIILNDIETGIPIAILDADLITHYRTAVSVLIAAKLFAPAEPKIVTLIGPGKGGMHSLLLLQHAFNLHKINVIYRSEESYITFCKFMKSHNEKTVEISRANLSEAILESDIIIAASTSMTPLLNESHFKKIKQKNLFVCGLSGFQDISQSILKNLDNIIVDDGENSIKRIEEAVNTDFFNEGIDKIYSLTDSPKSKNAGINLFLPTGVSALDIGFAYYIYKKDQQQD